MEHRLPPKKYQQVKGIAWWAGLWPFAILAAYFLLGLWGNYISMPSPDH